MNHTNARTIPTGVQCETRWLQIPYKPLSQRMLEEPFWLGLITIAVVLVAIGLVWCIKRYFAEKIERFVTEELERGKLDGDGSPNGDWRRLRTSRSSLEPILSQAGLHNFSRSNSPQPNHLNVSGWKIKQIKPSIRTTDALLNRSRF